MELFLRVKNLRFRPWTPNRGDSRPYEVFSLVVRAYKRFDTKSAEADGVAGLPSTAVHSRLARDVPGNLLFCFILSFRACAEYTFRLVLAGISPISWRRLLQGVFQSRLKSLVAGLAL